MSEHATREERIRKLAELIKDVEFAMLTTVDTDGSLRSRPMAVQPREFDGDLWFFTKASTPKVDEVEREEEVNVSFSRPDRQHYVSVSGKARVVRDRARVEEFWSPELKAWFPQGSDDPDLALLQVRVSKAEYWDSRSSLVSHVIGLVKAAVTGASYDPGENEKIKL
jgi:general stress protein 26